MSILGFIFTIIIVKLVMNGHDAMLKEQIKKELKEENEK